MKIKLTQDLGDGYVDSIEIEDATLTEVLVLTDAFFNDGKRVEEAQESVVDGENEVQESELCHSSRVWNNAPAWATKLKLLGLGTGDLLVWCNNEKYQYKTGQQTGRVFTFNVTGSFTQDDFNEKSTLLAYRSV